MGTGGILDAKTWGRLALTPWISHATSHMSTSVCEYTLSSEPVQTDTEVYADAD